MNRPDLNHRDLRYRLLCALLVLGAMALTLPVAECGVNDDWSYTKTALDLAQTGHLIYNGWAAATLGAQAYWGALFIKLFGFSFLAVRLSTAPLAAGCAVLLYALHRRANLPPGLAIFGALTIVLSPAFILNAVTFMTDIPSLFFLLASVYGYVRVAEVLDGVGDSAGVPAAWRKPFLGWLALALVAGMLGGTVRQTGWIMPVFAPLFLLVRRRTFLRLPPARLPLALSSVIAFGAALWFLAWFKEQPYAVPEEVFGGFSRVLLPKAPLFLCRLALRILLTLGVCIFPLLFILPGLYRSWQRGQPATGARIRGVLLLSTLFGLIVWKILDYRWVFPWFDNTFIFTYLLGTAPIPPAAIVFMLSIPCRKMISVCFIALVSGSLALRVATSWWWPAQTAKTAGPGFKSAVFTLFGMFSIAVVVERTGSRFVRHLRPLSAAAAAGGHGGAVDGVSSMGRTQLATVFGVARADVVRPVWCGAGA
jgi:4-amino-4-deoxy-L-arabinose transferase-like glycosyltransferase